MGFLSKDSDYHLLGNLGSSRYWDPGYQASIESASKFYSPPAQLDSQLDNSSVTLSTEKKLEEVHAGNEQDIKVKGLLNEHQHMMNENPPVDACSASQPDNYQNPLIHDLQENKADKARTINQAHFPFLLCIVFRAFKRFKTSLSEDLITLWLINTGISTRNIWMHYGGI